MIFQMKEKAACPLYLLPTLGSSYVVVLGVEALLAVIAGYFLYAQLTARMFGGVALVVAGTL